MKWETINLSEYKGWANRLKRLNESLQEAEKTLQEAISLGNQELIDSIVELIKDIEYMINKPLNNHPAITVKIVDMRPGEIVLIDG
jgi:ABC-type uncharacterized transport system fused permease/ATPase subunit